MVFSLRRPSRLAPALAALLLACGGGDEGASSGPSTGGSGGTQAGGSGGASGKAGAAGQAGSGASGQGGGGSAGAAGGAAGQGGAAGGGAMAGSGGGDGGTAGAGGIAAGAGGSAAGAGGSAAGSGGATAGSGGSAAGSGGSDAGAGGSAAGSGGSDAGSGGIGGEAGAGGGCATGELCEGGLCAGGVCCKASLACGESCCEEGQLCSFGACVVPGKTCFDSSECGASEYCEQGGSEPAGGGGQGGQCTGGSSAEGVCLPLPPICAEGESGVGPGGQITCLQKCEVKPDFVDFTPELKYAWGGQTTGTTATDIMMTPIVVQLDDDDCDGKVTERDIPEIIFTTFASGSYTAAGVLHAISIVNGEVIEKWSVPSSFNAGKQIAGGDLDGLPGSEVVGCTTGGAARAYGSDGKLLWTSTLTGCGQPSIADMDGDGKPEVIIEGGILDGATGATKAAFSPAMIGTFVVSDLDLDGKPDVVSASQAYHGDGSQFVNVPAPDHTFGGCGSSYYFCSGPAVADLDKDGKPEVVAVHFNQHALTVWQYDASKPGKYTVVRAGVDINKDLNPALCGSSAGSKWGGGPVTVGDFNADTFPDVALAGGVGYAVFDGKKLMDVATAGPDTFLWVKQTQDCSSAGTGSSLFDFNGDGKAEVLYADEKQFRIYEGATGNILFETCNTSGTLSEYPLVADVDNDGQADIIVSSNAYSSFNCGGVKTSGIRVFSSKSGGWVRTRRVWNQHAYHVTNVNEDGSIPAVEPTNWTQPGLNNFRINKQPGLEFAAPDVVIELRPDCAKGNVIAMIVRNLGQSVLPPGVVVDLFKGNPPNGQLINEQFTTQALFPAQSEILYAIVDDPEVLQGLSKVYGVVSFTSNIEECRKDNNVSPAIFGACAKF